MALSTQTPLFREQGLAWDDSKPPTLVKLRQQSAQCLVFAKLGVERAR